MVCVSFCRFLMVCSHVSRAWCCLSVIVFMAFRIFSYFSMSAYMSPVLVPCLRTSDSRRALEIMLGFGPYVAVGFFVECFGFFVH